MNQEVKSSLKIPGIWQSWSWLLDWLSNFLLFCVKDRKSSFASSMFWGFKEMEKGLLFSPLPFWMISDYALNYIKGPLILVYFTKFKQIFISYVRMISGNQIWLPFVLGPLHTGTTQRVMRCWHRLPRQIADALSLAVFKARLGGALSDLV